MGTVAIGFRTLVVFVLLLLAGVRATFATWVVDSIEDGPYVIGVSLLFDAQDRPHLVYGGDHLYHAVRDGGTWSFEVVDPGPNTGAKASIAFGPGGEEHVVYRPVSGAEIRHAERQGATWVSTIAAADSYPGNVGRGLAIDASGGLFAYADTTNDQMHVARRPAGTWINDTVDTNTLGYGTITAASQGRVFASYHLRTDSVKLATWNGTGWTTEVVNTNSDYDGGSAVAADSAGRPVVAFRDATTRALKVARWNGTSWITDVVDANGAMATPAIAVNGADQPVVTYIETGSWTLRVATFDGTFWSTSDVSAPPDVAKNQSLALDAAGRPAVAYVDNRTGELVLRHYDGTGWPRDVVILTRSIEWPGKLAVDAAGNPVVAYQVLTIGGEIWWARWTGSGWDRRPVPGTSSPSWWTGFFLHAMKLDPAGNPILAVTDPNLNSLGLMRWDGTAWSWESVAPDGSGNVSMDLDSAGNPTLVYPNSNGLAILAAHHDGTSWNFFNGPPLGSNPGVYTALRLTASGDPVIAYLYDNTSFDEARLGRWNGTGWDVETLWNGTNEQALSNIGLALDAQDRPLVSFPTFENGPPFHTNSRVTRWTGTAWQPDVLWSTPDLNPSTLDAVAFDGQGRPRALSWDFATDSLELVTHDGTAWGRETLASGLSVVDSMQDCMQLDGDGIPMILFVDRGDHSLKLARWSAGLPATIRRGTDPALLPPLVTASLPWTDPDSVLTPAFPPLLFYQVDVGRVSLIKDGNSIRIAEF